MHYEPILKNKYLVNILYNFTFTGTIHFICYRVFFNIQNLFCNKCIYEKSVYFTRHYLYLSILYLVYIYFNILIKNIQDCDYRTNGRIIYFKDPKKHGLLLI